MFFPCLIFAVLGSIRIVRGNAGYFRKFKEGPWVQLAVGLVRSAAYLQPRN